MRETTEIESQATYLSAIDVDLEGEFLVGRELVADFAVVAEVFINGVDLKFLNVFISKISLLF